MRYFIEGGGRIDRVIPCVVPSVDEFEQEPPGVQHKAYAWAMQESNRLADEAAFSARGHRKFKAVMAEYIEIGRVHRRNTGFESHARAVVSTFGDRRLSAITRDEVRAWIKDMEREYASKTIANRVATARACVQWLIDEDKWTGANVFARHEWNGQGEAREIKPTITRDELDFILANSKSPQFQQAVTIGYYTGLRPSEVCAVREADFNHDSLYLIVRVAKSKKRAATRRVAIPAVLSAWIINHGYAPMNYNTFGTALKRFVTAHPEFKGLCLETMRHNFSNLFRLAGVSADIVDVHQGRITRIQDTEYNAKDPMFAVNMMRGHLDKVFNDNTP